MKKINYVENLQYIIFPRELYLIKKKLQDSSDNINLKASVKYVPYRTYVLG